MPHLDNQQIAEYLDEGQHGLDVEEQPEGLRLGMSAEVEIATE